MAQKPHHFKYLAGARYYARRNGHKVWKESYGDGSIRFYAGPLPSPTVREYARREEIDVEEVPLESDAS